LLARGIDILDLEDEGSAVLSISIRPFASGAYGLGHKFPLVQSDDSVASLELRILTVLVTPNDIEA
jgi:hypothetical protein